MTLGAEAAGVDVRLAIDFSKINIDTHHLNFSGKNAVCADVSKVDVKSLRSQIGLKKNEKIDFLFGGPPCQGFSLIGKRDPSDKRNNLLLEFPRYAKELQPRYVVIENVAGLIQGHGKDHVAKLIRSFKRINYNLSDMKVLDASHYGVPQKRKRLFLVFSHVKEVRLELPQPKEPVTTIKDALTDLPRIKSNPTLFKEDALPWIQKNQTPYSKMLLKIFKNSETKNLSFLTGCTLTKHSNETINRLKALPQGKTDPISRSVRLKWDSHSPTLRAGTDKEKGSYTAVRPIHPSLNRCITVREGARLQSFPDWFQFHPSIWHGFRQIGNSVPPLLAYSVFSQFLNNK